MKYAIKTSYTVNVVPFISMPAAKRDFCT